MRILDVLTSPWSIRPDKMAEIRNIYHAHLRGPKIDWKDMEARVGFSFGGNQQEDSYQVMNGVAVIPIKGVLTKGLSFFSFLFGGSSMKQIGIAFQEALVDPMVESILLDIDSPGGSVDGTEELAQAIFQARGGGKPIIAYSDGVILSAAYWIASAADKIHISGDTVLVGSIGVVATHIDQSKADEMAGTKWTEISAGRYKRLASAHNTLTPEGATYLQDQVDYFYSVFVETVARNRGVDEKDALAMADGKTFIGKQAIEVGLVDGVSTFDGLINNLSAGDAGGKYSAKEDSDVTLEELKQKHPEVYAAALAEGKTVGIAEGVTSGKAAGIEEGMLAGAVAERQRIADVRAQLIPGHEALIEEMVGDGKTTGPEAAVKVLAAEKAFRGKKLDDYNADGSLKVPNTSGQDFIPQAAGETAKTMAEAGDKLDKFAQEIKAKDKCSYSEALAKARVAHPGLAKVYDGKEE